jgi:hypothetical protein
MWVHEYVGQTEASPEAVWAVLRDLDNWASWDTSMEWVRLQGPFGVGAQVVMKPIGQEAITSTIVAAAENSRYADETEFNGVRLRFSHDIAADVAGRTRVVHRLEITGPAAGEVGPQLGPAITEDFPQAMAALLARAEA